MSTHKVEVIKINEIYPHRDADRLAIVYIGDYPCIIRSQDFKVGDLAAYIEPDSLVPIDQPEFDFLRDKAKDGFALIRVVKLRGQVSYGLLIKARPGWQEGDNVMEELEVKHYQPVGNGSSQAIAPGPKLFYTKYDMENQQRYPNILQVGEKVQITEKIHGANSRFVFSDNKLHVSTHTNWKPEDKNDMYWEAARLYNLEEKLAEFPDYIFYGEVYGQVQSLRYGHSKWNPIALAFFDILQEGSWVPPLEAMAIGRALDLPWVPEIYTGPWNPELAKLADGPSLVEGADNIREGIVIKPLTPRIDNEIGRVILKIVSNNYLIK